jgi:uncharacterized membrane protein YozB (DUF420 family)
MNSTKLPHIPISKKILLVIALLSGVAFIVAFAIPYILMDPAKIERFIGREFWIVTHVGTGIIALLVGPVQFWLGWKSKYITHKKLGLVYLIAIAFSSLSAFYLAVTTEVSWIFGLGLGGLGVAWVLTTGAAFIAIRKRKIVLHREWMTRSYIVTMGFVFFRLFVGVTTALGVGTLFERLETASWFCWAFPLLIGEIFIQKKKLFG